MAYQVKNKRNADGSYTLSYGRGESKLEALMKNVHRAGWGVVHGDGMNDVSAAYGTMKECKLAWGQWAQAQYEGDSETQTAETSPVPSGPPSFTPKLADGPPGFTPKPKAAMTQAGYDYEADPFDPRFRVDGEFTPLGVIVQIAAWETRAKAAIKALSPEHARSFSYLIESVHNCIARECSDLRKGHDDDSADPDPATDEQPVDQPPAQQYPSGPPKLYTDHGGTYLEDDIPF